jgi:hypothetical protein
MGVYLYIEIIFVFNLHLRKPAVSKLEFSLASLTEDLVHCLTHPTLIPPYIFVWKYEEQNFVGCYAV